jgi:hypothetical protein
VVHNTRLWLKYHQHHGHIPSPCFRMDISDQNIWAGMAGFGGIRSTCQPHEDSAKTWVWIVMVPKHFSIANHGLFVW